MLRTTTPVKRTVLLAAASLALTAAPFALATPAQAAAPPSIFACSVTPLSPIFVGYDSHGKKLTDFPVTVNCLKDRFVTVQHRIWEIDFPAPNQLIQSSSKTAHVGAGKTVTLHNVRLPINTEAGPEEVFHQARFQEDPPFGIPLWSSWRSTPVISMP
jgi:hypothetical protein